MTTDKEIMDEIHAIRVKIYEETKHMTPEDRAAFIHNRVEEGAARYGIKLKRPVPAPHPQRSGK